MIEVVNTLNMFHGESHAADIPDDIAEEADAAAQDLQCNNATNDRSQIR